MGAHMHQRPPPQYLGFIFEMEVVHIYRAAETDAEQPRLHLSNAKIYFELAHENRQIPCYFRLAANAISSGLFPLIVS